MRFGGFCSTLSGEEPSLLVHTRVAPCRTSSHNILSKWDKFSSYLQNEVEYQACFSYYQNNPQLRFIWTSGSWPDHNGFSTPVMWQLLLREDLLTRSLFQLHPRQKLIFVFTSTPSSFSSSSSFYTTMIAEQHKSLRKMSKFPIDFDDFTLDLWNSYLKNPNNTC